MQPLGSPQGSHYAPAHLLGVQRRVQHAAAAAFPVASLLLLLLLLLLKRPDDRGSGGAERRRRRAAVRQRENGERASHSTRRERGSASEASTHCRQPSASVRVCARSKENSSPSSPRLAESVVRASGGGASVFVCKCARMCARPHVTQIPNIHTLRGAELGHMIQSADLNQVQQCLHI